ncbi:MAG: hypothetical protein JST25_00360 [Actinobacteria bacterium]|nr:hypothetical protein [Actinomycetota bacterium]
MRGRAHGASPSLPAYIRPDASEGMRGIIELAEEPHRRLTARTAAFRTQTAIPIAHGEGAAIGFGGQRRGGRGMSPLAVAAVSATMILSVGITAHALFGGSLLRSFGG